MRAALKVWTKKKQSRVRNAARKARYNNDPEYKAKMQARARRWRNANPEKVRAQRGHSAEYHRDYYLRVTKPKREAAREAAKADA